MEKLKEAGKQIGKRTYYETDGMRVACNITEVKSAYGRILYKMVPVSGSGFKWTSKEPGKGLGEVNGE